MAVNENERILRLRNETSLCLDDLVTLVINSSMAMELRNFSEEVMQKKPNFAFSLKQARELRDITRKALKQYESHALDDGGLMNYLDSAQEILKGEKQTNGGGNRMGMFGDLFSGKERKKQESMDKLEKNWKSVCEEILSCEKEMEHCIEASQGYAPDSMVYRSNERAYNNAKDKLALLRKQEQVLSAGLGQARRAELIATFNQSQRETLILLDNVLVDKDLTKTQTEVEIIGEKLNGKLSSTAGYGDSLIKDSEELKVRPDSEFSAMVAASERRKAAIEVTGAEEPEAQTEQVEQESDFDREVKAHSSKEQS